MNASKTRAARAAIWAIALVCAAFAGATRAQSIIDEWSSVKAPPPPELKKVTFDRKTTALLLLDFMVSAWHSSCTQLREPFHRIALLQDALQNWNELLAMGNSEIIGGKLSGRQGRIVQHLA